MKTRTALLLMLTTLLPIMACTHRQTLDASSGPEAYFYANQMTAGHEAEVTTRDGQVFRWRNVRFSPDSTYGVPLDNEESRLPTVQVHDVTVKSRGGGEPSREP